MSCPCQKQVFDELDLELEDLDEESSDFDSDAQELFDAYQTDQEELEYEREVNQRSRSYVRWVQSSLNRIMRARLAEDGILGPATRNAIRRFQRSQRLAVDGTVGQRTERALVRAGAPPFPGAQVITLPPVAIGAMPCKSLDRFEFRSHKLTSNHQRQIAAIAQRIADSYSTPQPIQTVYATGHTDSTGSANYNQRLGLRRALGVRRALMRALDSRRRGLSARVLILSRSRGERQPVSRDAAINRRVEVCLSIKALRPIRPRPPKPVVLANPVVLPVVDVVGEPPRTCKPKELDEAINECRKDLLLCTAKCEVDLERILARIKLIPGLVSCLKLGNPYAAGLCALSTGGKDLIDEYFHRWNCHQKCRFAADICAHNAHTHTRCP